jgi:hypothetical protein
VAALTQTEMYPAGQGLAKATPAARGLDDRGLRPG